MPWIRGLQVHRSTHPSLAARSHTTATFRGTPRAPRQAPAPLLPESNLQVSAQCFPSPCTQTPPPPRNPGAQQPWRDQALGGPREAGGSSPAFQQACWRHGGGGRGRGPLSSTTCTPCSGPCRAQSRTDREGVLSLTNKTSPHSTVSCLSIIMDRPAAIRLTRLVPLGCLPPVWYCAQWPVTLPLLLLCLPFLLRCSAQTCLGHSFADMEKDVDAPGEFRTIASPSLYIRSLVSAPAAKTSSDSALGGLPALSAT